MTLSSDPFTNYDCSKMRFSVYWSSWRAMKHRWVKPWTWRGKGEKTNRSEATIDLTGNLYLQNTSYSQTSHSLRPLVHQRRGYRGSGGLRVGAGSDLLQDTKEMRRRCDTHSVLPPGSCPWEREELPQMWSSCYGPGLAPCLCLSPSPRTRPRRLAAACSSGLLWLWASWRACGPCNGPLLGSKTNTHSTNTHIGTRT